MDQPASNTTLQPAPSTQGTSTSTPPNQAQDADLPPTDKPASPSGSQSDVQEEPKKLEESADKHEEGLTVASVSAEPTPDIVESTTPGENKEDEVSPSLQNDIPVPANAVSGPLKEFAPPVAAPVVEVVTPTEAEPDIPQEVKEAGVEATPNTDQPNISDQIQQTTGIKPVNDAVPLPTAFSDSIKLPMPAEEAQVKIKTSKVADSIRWLATLIVEQAKRAHGQLIGR